jgi:hypothetical protein
MLTSDVSYRDQAANLRGLLVYEKTAPGNTLHGLTNPAADGCILPAARDQATLDRRAWSAMQLFLAEGSSRRR